MSLIVLGEELDAPVAVASDRCVIDLEELHGRIVDPHRQRIGRTQRAELLGSAR
jgi:hypothetical protein